MILSLPIVMSAPLSGKKDLSRLPEPAKPGEASHRRRASAITQVTADARSDQTFSAFAMFRCAVTTGTVSAANVISGAASPVAA